MKIRELSLCGLLAALMALCAWLSVPLFGIPITLQTFAVFLALMTLGGKLGTAALGAYLCLGAMGLPVFSGFGGGLGVLLGPTGGYLWGFLASGLAYWLMTSVMGEKSRLWAGIVGLALCYVCGILWFAVGYANGRSLWEVFLVTAAPFFLPDGMKLFFAFFISRRLRRHFP